MEIDSVPRTLEAPRGNRYAPAWGKLVMMMMMLMMISLLIETAIKSG